MLLTWASDTFPRLVVNGKAEEKDWWATRKTRNADTKQGLNSPTSGDIRCYSSQTAANVMEVPAGATVHWVTSQQMNHPGPTQYYLAKAPEGSSVTKWDGSGNVWFKFHTTTATIDKSKQMSWPNQSKSQSGHKFSSRDENANQQHFTSQINTPQSTPRSQSRLPTASTCCASNRLLCTCQTNRRSIWLVRKSKSRVGEAALPAPWLLSQVHTRRMTRRFSLTWRVLGREPMLVQVRRFGRVECVCIHTCSMRGWCQNVSRGLVSR